MPAQTFCWHSLKFSNKAINGKLIWAKIYLNEKDQEKYLRGRWSYFLFDSSIIIIQKDVPWLKARLIQKYRLCDNE